MGRYHKVHMVIAQKAHGTEAGLYQFKQLSNFAHISPHHATPARSLHNRLAL
jgi:hypothetical protein